MIMKPVVCIAMFTAKPEKTDVLTEKLSALVPVTRAEDGCITYVLHKGIGNPNLLVMFEKFQDQEAYDFHNKQPYLLQLIDELPALVDDVSVELFNEV